MAATSRTPAERAQRDAETLSPIAVTRSSVLAHSSARIQAPGPSRAARCMAWASPSLARWPAESSPGLRASTPASASPARASVRRASSASRPTASTAHRRPRGSRTVTTGAPPGRRSSARSRTLLPAPLGPVMSATPPGWSEASCSSAWARSGWRWSVEDEAVAWSATPNAAAARRSLGLGGPVTWMIFKVCSPWSVDSASDGLDESADGVAVGAHGVEGEVEGGGGLAEAEPVHEAGLGDASARGGPAGVDAVARGGHVPGDVEVLVAGEPAEEALESASEGPGLDALEPGDVGDGPALADDELDEEPVVVRES